MNTLDKSEIIDTIPTSSVNVVAYDPSGAPLRPEALVEFEALLEAFAQRERLLLCYARQ